MRRLWIIMLVAVLPLTASARKVSIAQLRDMAAKGTPSVTDQHSNRVALRESILRYTTLIEDKLTVNGYVVASASYPRHANLDASYQHSFYESTSSISMAVAYLESPDGKCAIRLHFNREALAKKLPSFSFSELNLKGTRLIKEGDTYSVEGLTDANIVFSEPCELKDIPVKEKTIAELTPQDIYTYVRIKDCELVFKNGAFTNVGEEYLLRSSVGRNLGSGHADSWGRLLMDSRGDRIFMHINTRFPYRREGGGVPRGRGTVEGIIVDTYLPRWGVTGCRYGIRPTGSDDIKLDWMGEPGFGTLAAWDWNRPSEGLIPAETGMGSMVTDTGAEVQRIFDFDNPLIDKPGERADSRGLRGRVERGAMQLVSRSCDWWDWENDTPRSLMLIIPTRGIRSDGLFVAFTFSAGDCTVDHSAGYPSWWGVSYSADGRTWHRAGGEDSNLRALPYRFYGRPIAKTDGEKYVESAESAIGNTEHVYELPPSLLEGARFFVKIHPTRKVMAGLGYMQRDNWALREDSDGACYVNFGEILIGYRR